jgi:GNAT superfamily N-acetyltransferase
MTPKIIVDYLANHPKLGHELARLSWAEWRPIYQARGQTFEHALKNYRDRTNTDCLPLALVALHSGELVGTVSLKFNDLDTRPDIDPWLGALLVLPSWRGRGAGSLLMRRAVEEAARLRIPTLFLWTSSAERLYLKLGWRAIERTDYCGKNIVIMQIDVGNSDRESLIVIAKRQSQSAIRTPKWGHPATSIVCY